MLDFFLLQGVTPKEMKVDLFNQYHIATCNNKNVKFRFVGYPFNKLRTHIKLWLQILENLHPAWQDSGWQQLCQLDGVCERT